MTKADLIERVSKETGTIKSKRQIRHLVELVFAHLYKGIRKDKHFTYPGFGTWNVVKRKARKGRNPKTGEEVIIAANKTIVFKPAPNFKAHVQ